MKNKLLILLLSLLVACQKDIPQPDTSDCGYYGHIRLFSTKRPIDSVKITAWECSGPVHYNGKYFVCEGDSLVLQELYTDTAGYFKTTCPRMGLGFRFEKPGYWKYGKQEESKKIYYLAMFSSLTVTIRDTVSTNPSHFTRFSITDSISGYPFFSDSTSGPGIFSKTGKCGGDVINRVTISYPGDSLKIHDTSLYIFCGVGTTTKLNFTVPKINP